MNHTADFAAVTMLHLTDSAPFCIATPQHPGLNAWSKVLRRLRFALRDIETEAPAERLRALLYGARLHCVASTLPFHHPLIWDARREDEARALAHSIAGAVPEVPDLLEEALRLLHLLQLFSTNPVAAALQADLNERRTRLRPRTWPGYPEHPERWAVVVRSVFQAAIREQWAHEPDLAVLTPQEMTGDRVFEHVYFLGAARRYHPALLASPHALGTTLYRYAFVFDEAVRRPVTALLRDHGEDVLTEQTLPLLPEIDSVEWKSPQARPAPAEEEAAPLPEPEDTEPEEAVVWPDEVSPDPQSAPLSSAVQGVPGKLREVVIATEHGTETLWLDEAVMTPRLDVSYPPSIEAVTGATVREGDVLLLRTEGTQLTYSRDLARTEFGETYLRASKLHAAFKKDLNAAVAQAGGRRQAVKLMVRHGADRTCTVSNLSTWIKPIHFRPDSDATYAAMLTFTGWTDRRAELDEAIHLLRSSHIYAGRRAGEERLKLLLKLDFARLEEKGYLEVELGGGKVGAHRVVQVDLGAAE